MPNFTSDGKRGALIGFAAGVAVLISFGTLAFLWIFNNRIYPGVYIDNIPVSGLTKKEAWALLQQKLPVIADDQTITLKVGDVAVSSSSAQLSVTRDYDQPIAQSYELGRSGSLGERLGQLGSLFAHPTYISTHLIIDHDAATALIYSLKHKIDKPGHEPHAKLGVSRAPNTLQIDPGLIGSEIDTEKTIAQMNDTITHHPLESGPWNIDAVVSSTGSHLNDDQIVAAKERATHLIGKRLLLRAPGIRIETNDQQLVSFLQLPDGVNHSAVDEYVATWKQAVTRPAENAVFTYDPKTLIVSEFKPDTEGLELDEQQTKQLITDSLNTLTQEASPPTFTEYHDTDVQLPVKITKADTTLDKTNDLGIKERIGFGESEYDHSIPNRIHNVAITAARINNVIVPAGKEFSFNKTLGEVSAATGYRSAYVIKDGKTELGDGGGVCQVSTTLFRAVLNAGLEVTRRIAHSYRVSYYELNAKPGIDATVYAGETDFRFKNDTDHAILIHTMTDSENLYMNVEIYGTSDGRTSAISDHEVWDFVPAPPPEFFPDPTIPHGQRKQIDWSVAGVKAKFTNTVKDKDGKIIHQDTYFSNYKPWSAKYLVGV